MFLCSFFGFCENQFFYANRLCGKLSQKGRKMLSKRKVKGEKSCSQSLVWLLLVELMLLSFEE
jgi:hypothetical protein